MAENNYFFTDGSALLADIAAFKKRNRMPSKRLDIVEFSKAFTGHNLYQLHGGSYKRFVVYFVQNEDRIKDSIVIPPFHEPGAAEDIQIKYCGKKVRGASAVNKWILANNPPKIILQRLHKSEKAVDTQICCDALHLAALGKLDRFFIYTNDYDFIPLCRALKLLGANVSLFRLEKRNVNKDLAKECDTFSVAGDAELTRIFV